MELGRDVKGPWDDDDGRVPVGFHAEGTEGRDGGMEAMAEVEVRPELEPFPPFSRVSLGSCTSLSFVSAAVDGPPPHFPPPPCHPQ